MENIAKISTKQSFEELQQSYNTLRAIIECLSVPSPENFFEYVAKFIAKTLNVPYAFVGEADRENPGKIKMLAFVQDQEIRPGMSYNLEGTPCETVFGKKLQYYANNVDEMFPEDEHLVQMKVKCYIGVPLFDSHKKPIGVMVMMDKRDRTSDYDEQSLLQTLAVLCAAQLERQYVLENLKAEKANAEKANQLKTQFLANTSHEIRTPMTSVLGYTEMLANDGITPGLKKKAISSISNNGKRLLNLIDDILFVAQSETSSIKINVTQFSPVMILEQIRAELADRAEKKGLELRLSVGSKLPVKIDSDFDRLTQILINLTENAIKFTDSGHVELFVEGIEAEGAPRVRFQVRDTGPGILEKNQKIVFEPFRRAREKGDEREGYGLGLTITRTLAQLLKGSITLQSQPKKGTTFTVEVPSLPLPKSKKPSSLKIGNQDRQFVLADTRILVVEDSPDIQELTRLMLEEEGAKVSVANDGNEALQKLGRSKDDYDLVIMDIRMPGENGFQTLDRIKESSFNKPIIALTASALDKDRAKAFKAGFTDFLTKPIDQRSLVESCVSSLERPTRH